MNRELLEQADQRVGGGHLIDHAARPPLVRRLVCLVLRLRRSTLLRADLRVTLGLVRLRRERTAPVRHQRSAVLEARAALASVSPSEIGAVLNRYLASRLALPPGSVSGAGLRGILERRGVAAGLIDQVVAVQYRCDVARFAGDLSDSDDLAGEVRAALDALEGAL